MWWVASDLGGREVGPGGHVVVVDGLAPCREGWGEHGRVVEGDAVGNCMLGDDGVGGVGGGVSIGWSVVDGEVAACWCGWAR